ncbi:hypothetical protein [Hyphococcus luteus]|uniref:Uncharacterized protein n=1 Tax=Hyphococcus luteus TaxID=2058213 RepID=A0A2S7K660_9PROT|nr:hypothetical protein [Marinicaulis flavus]PQA88004.1 hypothetical protein CW354_06620 [Marinicaulis flavus]
MNSLKTLGALVAGVILLAAFYGAAFKNDSFSANIETDDGEGVRQVVHGDRGEFSLNRDGLKIKASWRGDYELSEDGEDIASLDKKLEISREEGGHSERAVFERDGDGVDRSYYLDGDKQGDTAETQEAIRGLLAAFLGASGVKAEERTAILLRRGGPDAVISEIGAVYGDHARQRYTAELTEQADLSGDQLRALLEALKAIDSDHDMRMALGAILENETITPDATPVILETAGRIESDYDLRRLIETIAEKPMSPEAVKLAIKMIGRIDNDHNLRRAAEALLEQDSLTPAMAAEIIDLAADRLDSDHDMRLLLGETAPYLAADGDAATAWVAALGAVDSDHDKRLALSDAANEEGLSDDVMRKLIEATEKIESDSDRRLALETFASRAKTTPALLEAYETAARGISSDSERDRALDAAGLED